MTIQCISVPAEEKGTLNNLLEKYNYEFSQYDKIPFGEDGLYGYPYLDCYFTDSDRYAYFIVVDGKLAGFALINKRPECDSEIDWAVAEFFVAYPYRGKGVATEIMNQIFALHKGIWHIKYHPANTASVRLWNKVAEKYAVSGVERLRGSEDYYDGTPSTVLVFTV